MRERVLDGWQTNPPIHSIVAYTTFFGWIAPTDAGNFKRTATILEQFSKRRKARFNRLRKNSYWGLKSIPQGLKPG